jgi:hypothetical protein
VSLVASQDVEAVRKDEKNKKKPKKTPKNKKQPPPKKGVRCKQRCLN